MVPGICINFFEERRSNGLDGIFRKTGLRGMLEQKGCRVLCRVFLFVAAFIDRSTEHERTTTMTMMSTRYSEIVTDLMGGMGQQAWSEEELHSLEGKVKKFKRCW